MTICWPRPRAHTAILPPDPASSCALSASRSFCYSLSLSLLRSMWLLLVLSTLLCHSPASSRSLLPSPSPLTYRMPPLVLVPVRRKVPAERIAVRHKLLYFIVQFLFIIFFGLFFALRSVAYASSTVSLFFWFLSTFCCLLFLLLPLLLLPGTLWHMLATGPGHGTGLGLDQSWPSFALSFCCKLFFKNKTHAHTEGWKGKRKK